MYDVYLPNPVPVGTDLSDPGRSNRRWPSLSGKFAEAVRPVGEVARAYGVARSLIYGLLARNSPLDVRGQRADQRHHSFSPWWP